eukprot:2308590-Rhodomonas_salina.3
MASRVSCALDPHACCAISTGQIASSSQPEAAARHGRGRGEPEALRSGASEPAPRGLPISIDHGGTSIEATNQRSLQVGRRSWARGFQPHRA